MLICPAIPSITSNPADTSIVLICTGVDAYMERRMKNGRQQGFQVYKTCIDDTEGGEGGN